MVSDSLRPQGLQHARLPCSSPTPGAYSNSCPSSQWRHPTISSSVVPFSSCLQSFPAPGSFQMSWLFTSGDLSIGATASASVLPMNIQDWSSLGLTGLISLCVCIYKYTHTYIYVYMNLPAVQETWVQSLGQEQSPGEGNGYPLQYSCLENLMDSGAWQGYSSWSHKESGMTEQLTTTKNVYIHINWIISLYTRN